MENKNIDTEIKKLAKTSSCAGNLGCLSLLGTAGMFTYCLVSEKADPGIILPACFAGLLATYGLGSLVLESEKQIEKLKQKQQQKQR